MPANVGKLAAICLIDIKFKNQHIHVTELISGNIQMNEYRTAIIATTSPRTVQNFSVHDLMMTALCNVDYKINDSGHDRKSVTS